MPEDLVIISPPQTKPDKERKVYCGHPDQSLFKSTSRLRIMCHLACIRGQCMLLFFA